VGVVGGEAQQGAENDAGQDDRADEIEPTVYSGVDRDAECGEQTAQRQGVTVLTPAARNWLYRTSGPAISKIAIIATERSRPPAAPRERAAAARGCAPSLMATSKAARRSPV
jgi:hypothetical protein